MPRFCDQVETGDASEEMYLRLLADRKQALEAFHLLNYFVGDLVAATQVRSIFAAMESIPSGAAGALNRMCLSQLFLVLCKWCEFYDRFHAVLPKDCHAECKDLAKEIRRRKILAFRNTVIGHITDKTTGRPLLQENVEAAFQCGVDGDADRFSRWCNDPNGNNFPATVVSIVEHTRNRIQEEFSLADEELFPHTTRRSPSS